MSHKTLLNAWQNYQQKEYQRVVGELPLNGIYYIARNRIAKRHVVSIQYNQTLKRYEEILDGEIIHTLERVSLRMFENDLRSVNRNTFIKNVDMLGKKYIERGI